MRIRRVRCLFSGLGLLLVNPVTGCSSAAEVVSLLDAGSADASVAEAGATGSVDAGRDASVPAPGSSDAAALDAGTTPRSDAAPLPAAPDAAEAGADAQSDAQVRGGTVLLDVKHLFMAPGDTDRAQVLRAVDADGNPSDVAVTVSEPGVVSAALTGQLLELEALADGHATVTVTSESGADASFEIDVTAPRAVAVRGELLVGYVDQFELAYSDGGTGCDDDGTFWKPKPVAGFSPLGVYGRGGYDDPSGTTYTLVVRAVGNSDAVVPVLDQNLLLSKRGFSVWRPTPPEGYVALGDIVLPDGEPDLSGYALVREDLTRKGVADAHIWSCPGLEGSVVTSRIGLQGPLDFGEVPLVGNLAAAEIASLVSTSYNLDAVSHVLISDVPVVRDYDLAASGVPRTTTLDKPPATDPVRVRSILVPFNTVTDETHDAAWKVAHSPWYRLERRDYYEPVLHRVNLGATDLEQTLSYTVGVTESASETFTQSTSVTVSAQFGVELGGFSAGGGISVTQELGYERMTSSETFTEHTLSETISVPPMTVMTVWQLESRILLQRYNAGVWETVGDPDGLVSGADSLIFTQTKAD